MIRFSKVESVSTQRGTHHMVQISTPRGTLVPRGYKYQPSSNNTLRPTNILSVEDEYPPPLASQTP